MILESTNNMLLYYYPISKKHFDHEEGSSSSGDCIDASCDSEKECNMIECKSFGRTLMGMNSKVYPGRSKFSIKKKRSPLKK